MSEKTQTTGKATDPETKAKLEESTGYMSPGQLEMEKTLGLEADVNLPATPEERQPRPHPDNMAVSSMEHPISEHQPDHSDKS